MVQAFPYSRHLDKWRMLGPDNGAKVASSEQRGWCLVAHHKCKFTKLTDLNRTKNDHTRSTCNFYQLFIFPVYITKRWCKREFNLRRLVTQARVKGCVLITYPPPPFHRETLHKVAFYTQTSFFTSSQELSLTSVDKGNILKGLKPHTMCPQKYSYLC